MLLAGGCLCPTDVTLRNGEKADSLYYHERRVADELMIEMWIDFATRRLRFKCGPHDALGWESRRFNSWRLDVALSRSELHWIAERIRLANIDRDLLGLDYIDVTRKGVEKRNTGSYNEASGTSTITGEADFEIDGPADAIERFKNALGYVSKERSRMGAYQNRLEHTIKNLDNVVENTQSAESRIRDTDMAAEMVKYSNNNILAQAGQSMLAQANQTNQGVLTLLQ